MSYKDKNRQREYQQEYHKINRIKYHSIPKSKPHRHKVAKYLGFILLEKETVHHINGNHNDNRIENLYLFNNNSEHMKYHGLLKRWAENYSSMTEQEARQSYPFLKSNLPIIKQQWKEEQKNAIQK